MRWFATILVAVVSIVFLATPSRIDHNLARQILSGTAQDAASVKTLEKAGAVPPPAAPEVAAEIAAAQEEKAFEEPPKDSEEALPEAVQVAGLRFHTDITVITKALRDFGKSSKEKKLGSWLDWQKGGVWVKGCPEKGATELKSESLFITSEGRYDQKSSTMVPRQWKVFQQGVQAVRRGGTKSWWFSQQQHVCLLAGQEVVVLKDASLQCVSHRLLLEDTGRIEALCK